MFLRLTHLTRYDYSQPVAFAPHALYLRPRETPRQRLHDFKLDVTPAPRRIATRDAEELDPAQTLALEQRVMGLADAISARYFLQGAGAASSRAAERAAKEEAQKAQEPKASQE